ncbi:hypothetical protein [Streptomyces sp. NPDC015125]|uniref:hypothetical protein n=1 Tax=Streptomyces sp. NPDC015125 TaxID=3364938 RepID=UPI003702E3FA
MFGGLGTGRWADFPGEASLYRGSYQQVVLLNIECGEEDNGDILDEIQKHRWKIAGTAADWAQDIVDNGESDEAGLAALIAVVAALLTWLLSWLTNDDDLVDGVGAVPEGWSPRRDFRPYADELLSHLDDAGAGGTPEIRLFAVACSAPASDRHFPSRGCPWASAALTRRWGLSDVAWPRRRSAREK